MAAFPGAVKSFTTKNAGDVIQAAHVDDLQDEVTAIEDGYLNATARLNSSASTLNSLSVVNGSTLAGSLVVLGPTQSSNSTVNNLSVAGNSTIAGNLTVGGTINGGTPVVSAGCNLTHSARQDIPNGAFTGLSWDTETVDLNGMHSTSVNSSRINFAASTGLYLVGAAVEWAIPSTGNFSLIMRIMLNDATGQGATYVPGVTAAAFGQSVTAMVRATSTTDYVTAQVFLGGSTGGVNGSSAYGYKFWAAKVQ